MAVNKVARTGGSDLSRDDLMQMEPVVLRALLRERVHHTIEVKLYPLIINNGEPSPNFGLQAQLVYDVWQERGLSVEGDDFEWIRKYLDLAEEVRKGKKVEPGELSIPESFTDTEMKTVQKLIQKRHSIRNWRKKDIPGEMIEQILEAGRAAPGACNLNIVRFVILETEEEIETIWSDIRTPADRCTIIVIGYDQRVYSELNLTEIVPQNQILDCGAAADHMLLMAHALGLGGVWLTKTDITAEKFKKRSKVPDYFMPVLHIAVGWPEKGTIKSQRMPLEEMIIETGI